MPLPVMFERFSARSCFLLIASLAAVVTAAAQPDVTVLPGERIYPRYRADALEHQLSLSRVTDNREWIGVVGGELPLVDLRTAGLDIQAGVGASVFNRIIKTPGHITVFTVDYRIDFPIDVAAGDYVFRFGYGHISNHYADDGLEVLGLHSINAVKDYLNAGVARRFSWRASVAYAHVTWNYHNEPLPDKRWIGQVGGAMNLVDLATWAVLYGAFDLKCKEEVGGGTTRSFQLGVEFFRREGRAIRCAYTFRDGFEERGQLYAVSTTANLLSVFIDL
jgi:hypothetical protein